MALALSACGGASVDVNAAFASIQIDEARIERASLAGDGAEVCDASAHLCRTVGTLDDRDANQRCAHAAERCAEASP